jgi:hypothetical protein
MCGTGATIWDFWQAVNTLRCGRSDMICLGRAELKQEVNLPVYERTIQRRLKEAGIQKWWSLRAHYWPTSTRKTTSIEQRHIGIRPSMIGNVLSGRMSARSKKIATPVKRELSGIKTRRKSTYPRTLCPNRKVVQRRKWSGLALLPINWVL